MLLNPSIWVFVIEGNFEISGIKGTSICQKWQAVERNAKRWNLDSEELKLLFLYPTNYVHLKKDILNHETNKYL